MLQLITKKTSITFIIVAALALMGGLAVNTKKAEAACAAQDTSRGTVTSTFTIAANQGGLYTVKSRIMPNGTNDSFILEIDGTTCGVTVGNANTSATGWQWIDYRDGNTASKVTVNLAAGTHTMTLIGKEDAVQVDRVLFLADGSCPPTGFGDNCLNVDTTVPTTAITAPVNNAIVSGTVTIAASASDDVGVQRVEFYMGSNLLGTDTSAPYSFALNSSLYPPGTYQLTTRAYDTSSNMKTSSVVNITIPEPPDTTAPTVTLSSPVAGSQVAGTITMSASASDNKGVSKVEFLVDGIVKSTVTSSPYSATFDTKTVADGSHTISAKAYDTAATPNVGTATITVTVKQAVTAVSCDFTGDSKVGIGDLSVLLSNYGKTVTVNATGDCTGDGKVTIADLSTLLSKYGQ